MTLTPFTFIWESISGLLFYTLMKITLKGHCPDTVPPKYKISLTLFSCRTKCHQIDNFIKQKDSIKQNISRDGSSIPFIKFDFLTACQEIRIVILVKFCPF